MAEMQHFGAVDPTETWAVQDFCSANWLSSARQTACFAAFIFVLMAAETCEPGDPMAADAAHAPDNQPKAKIFISYSRKDMGFADRLQTELEARGLIVLIDRSEIYAFEDWWTRIQALIVKADTIIFVLSPDAVASDICARVRYLHATLEQAATDVVMKELVEQHGDGGVIALDRKGNIATPFNTTGMMNGVVRADGKIKLSGWNRDAEPLVVGAQ